MKAHILKKTKVPCWVYNLSLDILIDCNQTDGGGVKSTVRNHREEILSGIDQDGIHVFGSQGELIAFKVNDNILVNKSGNGTENVGLTMQADISEELNKILKKEIAQHKQTQEKLKAHSAMLNAIFDSTALYIWTMKLDGNLTSFNPRIHEQMKIWFEKDLQTGEPLKEDSYTENIEEWKRFQHTIEHCSEGDKNYVELELTTMKGEKVWVEIHVDPVKTEDASIDEVSCIGFEVTDRKMISNQISQSLKEKETLLQEVHHRVKNNLQIISSLLNLQSSYVKDEQSLDVLKESQNRIKSMSFIHESLYMNKNFSSVDLREYVKGLSSSLLHSYCLNPERMNVSMDVDQLTLNLDQAIPCGLIINELVSNTFKHAYPDGQDGILKISIKEKEGRMAIMVADDGIGISEDWDLENSESLGLQLVYTLTEQLDGDIEFSGEKGTKYLITFDRIKTSRSWPKPTY